MVTLIENNPDLDPRTPALPADHELHNGGDPPQAPGN
jgi:hypothetical protein